MTLFLRHNPIKYRAKHFFIRHYKMINLLTKLPTHNTRYHATDADAYDGRYHIPLAVI